MLLTCLISQLGSTGMLEPGCGGVQKVVHISWGGVTRMFHPRKRHLPVAAFEPLSTDEMRMPLFSSTKRFESPLPTALGLFPATVPGAAKIEKLSSYLPFTALMAYSFRSPAAIHHVGVWLNSLVVNCAFPLWRCSPAPPAGPVA